MKRLLDVLLSRWYVRRVYFEDAHRIIGVWERLFDVLLERYEAQLAADRAPRPCEPEIIVSADYQRGCPCS